VREKKFLRPGSGSIRPGIFEFKGVTVASSTLIPKVQTVGGRSGALARGRVVIGKDKAFAWSAESPRMYTLVVTLWACASEGGNCMMKVLCVYICLYGPCI